MGGGGGGVVADAQESCACGNIHVGSISICAGTPKWLSLFFIRVDGEQWGLFDTRMELL